MSSSHWKRRRRTDGQNEGHVDDWLMTYADMITLLLSFFAVFIAIAIPDEVKFEEAKKKVSEQFAGTANDYLKGVYSLPPTPNDNPPPSAQEPFKALPSIVDRFNGNENIEVAKGDRITTIEMNSAPFFPKGAATLSDEGLAVLAELKTTLTSDEYKDYTISVEGYTDDTPINTAQFPSNWELSTARAAAVVRSLIDLGVTPQRLRAVGFAETSPKLPNHDDAGKDILENQAQNRRVVIRLEKIIKHK